MWITVSLLFTLLSFGFCTLQEEKQIIESLMNNNYNNYYYDGDIRPPGFTNETTPTIVTVNMYVRSIDFVDTQNMAYQAQLTFRIQWLDTRLQYEKKGGPNFLSFPSSMVSRVWKPDLFFSNELETKTHNLPAPNEFLRVFPNGEVLHSSRITLKLRCPMNQKYYPFESFDCNLKMASYGYSTDHIIFKWKEVNPVQVTSNLHLPELAMTGFSTDYCDHHTNSGVYGCLRLEFYFRRVLSTVLSDVYLPMIVSLFLIWLSMWINPKESGIIRVALLVSAIAYSKWTASQLEKPRVSYSTLFDKWNAWCNFLMLVAVVEFTIVHLIKRHESNSLVHLEEGNKVLNAWRDQETDGKIDAVMKLLYPIAIVGYIIYYLSVISLVEEDGSQ